MRSWTCIKKGSICLFPLQTGHVLGYQSLFMYSCFSYFQSIIGRVGLIFSILEETRGTPVRSMLTNHNSQKHQVFSGYFWKLVCGVLFVLWAPQTLTMHAKNTFLMQIAGTVKHYSPKKNFFKPTLQSIKLFRLINNLKYWISRKKD